MGGVGLDGRPRWEREERERALVVGMDGWIGDGWLRCGYRCGGERSR